MTTTDILKFWNLLQLSFFEQLNKKSQLTFLWQIVALLFLQVQYIIFHLSEILFMLWKLQSLRSVYSLTYQPSLWLVTFWVLRFPPNRGKTWDLGLRKKGPFPLNKGVPSTYVTGKKITRIFACGQILHPLNRGVPSTDVADKEIIRIFAWDQILRPLDGSVPWIEVSQRRGSTV